jgi:alpha/beta superfamily hydrolase
MNEASSKYVDQFATQKLLQEKLSRVHHAPDPALRAWSQLDASARGRSLAELGIDAGDWTDLPPEAPQVTETRSATGSQITFASALPTGYPENDLVRCLVWPAGEPSGDLILVHGLYEDNLQMYGFLVSLLNAGGLNVYTLLLPYHYQRKPASSLFSGEYFWSADLVRSALAYKQAVYDLCSLYRYRKSTSGRPVGIVGFSMGGAIALLLAAQVDLEGVFAVNPVCNMGELVWSSSLFSTIRADLKAAGIGLVQVKASYSSYEPLNVQQVRSNPDRIVLGKSLYDQINDPGNCDLLAQRWQLSRVLSYKAGHLNVVRVPKLAADIRQFAMESQSA